MMTKRFLAVIFLSAVVFNTASSQFYHKDIISIKQANDEKKLMEKGKIRRVIIHSFEADGSPSEGFKCEKSISKNYKEAETSTMSSGTNPSVLLSYYNDAAQLIKSSDSSEITAASTIYEYDEKGNIKTITAYNHSADDDFSTSLKEVHQYIYNENNKPVKMLRIKNDKDTLQVDFIIDSKGNVTDEIEKTAGGKHYYYYYNDLNQLTDIVRYNVVKKAMRPDFVFEYNNNGQVSQMIAVEEGIPGSFYTEKDAANYYTWRYFYNDEGLRIVEKCYNNRGKLQGSFEYEYE